MTFPKIVDRLTKGQAFQSLVAQGYSWNAAQKTVKAWYGSGLRAQDAAQYWRPQRQAYLRSRQAFSEYRPGRVRKEDAVRTFFKSDYKHKYTLQVYFEAVHPKTGYRIEQNLNIGFRTLGTQSEMIDHAKKVVQDYINQTGDTPGIFAHRAELSDFQVTGFLRFVD